jgi:hypothetical protein
MNKKWTVRTLSLEQKKNKEASVYDCSNFDVELHRMR